MHTGAPINMLGMGAGGGCGVGVGLGWGWGMAFGSEYINANNFEARTSAPNPLQQVQWVFKRLTTPSPPISGAAHPVEASK